MVQKKKPGKTGTKAAKGAKNYGARPYAKPGGTKSDKGAPNAKPGFRLFPPRGHDCYSQGKRYNA